MESKEIYQRLTQCGIPATPELAQGLATYHRLLMDWNTRMDLTAVTEEAEMLDRHYVDALSPLARPGLLPQTGTLIDVGTGAGFPGLPLKILEPSLRLTLLDSLGKRVRWLESVCEALSLDNVACLHARAEEQALAEGFRDGFDLVTSRAVAALPLLCELCLPYVKVGGLFLAMKSVDSGEELNQAGRAIAKLGGRLLPRVDYTIPGTEIVHRVVVVEKVSPTPKGFPRRWAKMQKAPL